MKTKYLLPVLLVAMLLFKVYEFAAARSRVDQWLSLESVSIFLAVLISLAATRVVGSQNRKWFQTAAWLFLVVAIGVRSYVWWSK
jgi:hypothetical protein